MTTETLRDEKGLKATVTGNCEVMGPAGVTYQGFVGDQITVEDGVALILVIAWAGSQWVFAPVDAVRILPSTKRFEFKRHEPTQACDACGKKGTLEGLCEECRYQEQLEREHLAGAHDDIDTECCMCMFDYYT